MESARKLLEEYIEGGGLMQLATTRADGSPEVCNVWYDYHLSLDVLRFISRNDRNHSVNIRARNTVAGAVVSLPPEELGQPVRGVTFRGTGHELPTAGIEDVISAFVRRWPNAAKALDPQEMAAERTPTRMYELAVREWVLFDEVNFPQRPRQVIAGAGLPSLHEEQ